MHKLGMPVDYVTTKGPNPRLKNKNQEKFDKIKTEEITTLGVKEEGNEDSYEEDIEELELVDPNIEVAKEDNIIYRFEKQDSQEWTWSEPFTFT